MKTPRIKTILVADDEESLRNLISFHLSAEGYKVVEARDGRQAIDLAQNRHFDLIILDVMMPEPDGFQVCTTLSLEGNRAPIMFLTAKDAAPDRVKGLRYGADDYLSKPFDLEELLLRVSKLIERSALESGDTAAQIVCFAGNKVDFNTYRATTFKGEQIDLSKREAMLLRLLLLRQNQIVSREEILLHVWGYDVYPTTRTIDNFIVALRKYFEYNPQRPQHLLSVRGVGYRFIN